jgi:hypothetical protein
VTKSQTEKLLEMQRWGFWIRTKQTPPRAVRWDPQRHEDGRRSFRGANWVEVLPHGVTREPERFFAADVEHAGPHEWMTYFPMVGEPICGWAKDSTGRQFCPRRREDDQPFCPKHMTELESSTAEESHGRGQEGQ